MPRRRVTAVDWLMLVLALVSVGMLAYEAWGSPTPAQSRDILLADYAIVGIFALEFSIRWVKDEKPKTFPLRYWYDLLGMVPVAHPAIRGFRLFRIVRIVVLTSRFGRAADRAFGTGFTRRLLRRFQGVIVETIGDAVTVKVLDETLEVLQKGTYTKNLADALERHGGEVTDLVAGKVKADPALATVRRLPFFDDVVTTASRVTQRVLVETLRDPRMDQMVKDILRENVLQVRAAVMEKEYARQLLQGA
ncbi:MAG TPA: ion transporter [Candidatus Thermoplasmatota archaeon]|nr:ion transporter [Candidatus Thermoplasmatota archaeon]